MLLLAACGGSGGSAGNSGGNTAAQRSSTLALVDHSPADAAVQVPLAAELTFTFDGVVVADCLLDEDTWLRIDGSDSNVAGSFRLGNGGQTVVFHPDAPLQPETDYLFQLSPLTCDDAGRILELQYQLPFRTLDNTPPAIVSASVTAGATGVARSGPFQINFSESIAAGSVAGPAVQLHDVFGSSFPVARSVSASVLTVIPVADLPGDRQFVLQLGTSVTDRAGNRLAAQWSVGFRTIADLVPPTTLQVWPPNHSTGVSPRVQPTVTFSESMDPYSVEPSSLLFQDEFGSVLAFAVRASDDQRTLRIQPLKALVPFRNYTLAFLPGPAAVTDVSGNPLASTTALVFTTGNDATPPAITGMRPGDGATRVSPNVVPVVTFAEPLDPSWVSTDTVQLRAGAVEVAAVVGLFDGNTTLRVEPVAELTVDTTYTLAITGGFSGLRDVAGNVLPADQSCTFTTSSDAQLPQALLLPPDGAVSVPPGVHVAIVFDQPIDPTTVDPSTVQVLDEGGYDVAGTLAVGGSDRTVTFVPQQAWSSGAYYHTLVHGGPDGVRAATGNWLDQDLRAQYRIGFVRDLGSPQVRLTLNQTDVARNQGMCVPAAGFTIDLTASDPGEQSLDISSVHIELQGPGLAPAADVVFRDATVAYGELHYTLPAAAALTPGDWTVRATVADLSGNVGASNVLAFSVTTPTAGQLPFERTQVVWVRTDLDRDGNGAPDFDDDLLRLGLASSGDPAGTNARMHQLLLDGMLAEAYALLGRGPRGEVLGSNSVGMRYVKRQPLALAHMQIALGGLDPLGDRNRSYGAESTGVLGRALYDYRNGNLGDLDIGGAQGLGVFPAEMFLFQARIHQQVYPSFVTLFAQRFLPLCPAMGGTPVGTHADDAVVVAPGFVYATATTQQRARYNQIMTAADDWARVIGIILAHEVGHAVGLVAPGPSPSGLFGDATLHDADANATEVMAATVGYEAMVTLLYRFRDVDLAYLRQRLVLR